MGNSASSTNVKLIWIGRFAAVVLAVVVYGVLPAESLSVQARRTAALGTLIAVLWMTEGLPLAVTSLLPLVLFPLFDVLPFDQAAAPYASKWIFLFMAGFMIALSMERWNLHRRIALLTVLAVGTQPARLIGGFMIATAFLSMWISNTATTTMMLPIGVSVVQLVIDRISKNSSHEKHPNGSSDDPRRFATCLMLAIAYAASIGGMGTLIGTGPTVFFASFLSQNEELAEVGFGQWMLLGIPFVVVYTLLAWITLTRIVFPIRLRDIPGGRRLIQDELSKLGPVSRGERTVLFVFVATALAWVFRSPITNWEWLVERFPTIVRIDDSMIALMAALCLFVIPVDARRGVFALDWQTAVRLPWGILLLFGGGLSLAKAISTSGLADWIGRQVETWQGLPTVLIIVVVTMLVIFLTEITSNTATTTAFLPILAGVAAGLNRDAFLFLVPAVMAAGCAFMLPVATPPNAIVFGSGYVTIGQMMKGGLCLNLMGVVLITISVYLAGPLVFGIQF